MLLLPMVCVCVCVGVGGGGGLESGGSAKGCQLRLLYILYVNMIMIV